MTGVPNNIIIPFVGVDFDSSQAGTGSSTVPINLLAIGQRLSTGTVAAETKFLAFSADEVGLKAGYGSMLHRMAIYIFKNNTTVPTTFIGLDDEVASTAATHAFTITGSPTAAGELVCYVAGERFAVAVTTSDTPTTIGDAIAAVINADIRLQATAVNATGTVTLTCRNKGLAAGDLDVRFNYNYGEQFPAGISVGSITTTPGATDPDITDATAALGQDWFNVIVQPYTDNTNMNSMEDYLDSVAAIMESREAECYQVERDTLANLITFGTDSNRNSRYMITAMGYKRLQSTYEVAGAIAGKTAINVQDDPARPLHRSTLSGIDILSTDDKWTSTELNSLAISGIMTLSDDIGVQTHSCVTMYLKNDAGAADTAYQQQNTLFTLSALRYRFVNQILTAYPRAKLADNADGIGSGQQIMTEDIGRTEAIAWFKNARKDGLVEGGQAVLDQFISELVVQRDTSNLNRMNWLLPPDLINQFIVGSGTIQFRG